MIRIMLVDDEKILTESLKHILEEDGDIKIIGCANNGLNAIELFSSIKPDIILMDVFMPECNGIECAKLIKEKEASAKIIMLTTYYSQNDVQQAISYGVDGYLMKEITPKELIMAIKNIMNGMSIFHKPVFESIKGNFNPINYKADKLDYGLTDREKSIIKLIVEGKDNKEIAKLIYLSEGTVANNISNILLKLNIKNRLNLAMFAVKNNII